jgi:hypothetical protein
MGVGTHTRALQALIGQALIGLAIGALLLVAGGCRSMLPAAPAAKIGYRYFARPAPEDAWSRKIRGWQQRERGPVETPAVATEPPHVGEESGALRSKYTAFRSERRREMARDLADWIQQQSRDHYIADGAVDHWATLEETFRTNGDDCDGLELLTFHMLRELGFGDDEVYRAIVVRPSDGQHHMVTLWFENQEDPWVIDPTGAMTSGMPRMSEVPEWVPLKVFSEDRDFTVERGRLHTAQR